MKDSEGNILTLAESENGIYQAGSYYDYTSVDFETVWGAGHTQAERTGDSTSNFITWVNECLQSEQ